MGRREALLSPSLPLYHDFPIQQTRGHPDSNRLAAIAFGVPGKVTALVSTVPTSDPVDGTVMLKVAGATGFEVTQPAFITVNGSGSY